MFFFSCFMCSIISEDVLLLFVDYTILLRLFEEGVSLPPFETLNQSLMYLKFIDPVFVS